MRGRRGFSYLEVLAAMMVMSVGLLSLVPLFALGVKVNAGSRDLATASALAKEKLEELIAYPSTDPRLAIPSGATTADATNSARCANDLPRWWKPSTGERSTQVASPGAGWYAFPCTRTYTVQAYALSLFAPVASTVSDESVYAQPGAPAPYYDMKLVTVTVTPIGKMATGLRVTKQSAFVRFRNGA
jgi:type II secretory pathway pseudopilin PulG